MKIAITCIQLIRDIEEYRQAFETAGIELVIPRVSGQHLEGEDLILALKDCSGVIAGDDQFTREVLSNCTKLEVISKWGIGIDGIDRDAASDLGITVTNTPGEFNEEVADVAMGYCIMLLRQLHIINASVKKGEWAKPAGSSLAGKSIGIIGLGGLGHMGIKLAVAMGAEVVAITSSQSKVRDAIELGAKQVLVSTDENAVDLATGTFDLLINTIPADHDFSQYLGLLKRDKTMVIVGASHMKMFSMNLLFGRKKVAGSLIGGIKETQEMLDFCAKNNIFSDIEVVDIKNINQVFDDVVSNKVRYRAVIDMCNFT
mgnify:CR=1 FL=1